MQQSINQMLYGVAALTKLGGIEGELTENRKELAANREYRKELEKFGFEPKLAKKVTNHFSQLAKKVEPEYNQLAQQLSTPAASSQASTQAMNNVANQATAVQSQASNYDNLIKQLKGLTEESDKIANNSTKRALTKILEEHGGNE